MTREWGGWGEGGSQSAGRWPAELPRHLCAGRTAAEVEGIHSVTSATEEEPITLQSGHLQSGHLQSGHLTNQSEESVQISDLISGTYINIGQCLV